MGLEDPVRSGSVAEVARLPGAVPEVWRLPLHPDRRGSSKPIRERPPWRSRQAQAFGGRLRKGGPMRRYLPVLALLLIATGAVQARGLLIPEDKDLPPLAMLNHKVHITIDDQVAVTKVQQTFRNHTDRPLEATYL